MDPLKSQNIPLDPDANKAPKKDPAEGRHRRLDGSALYDLLTPLLRKLGFFLLLPLLMMAYLLGLVLAGLMYVYYDEPVFLQAWLGAFMVLLAMLWRYRRAIRRRYRFS